MGGKRLQGFGCSFAGYWRRHTNVSPQGWPFALFVSPRSKGQWSRDALGCRSGETLVAIHASRAEPWRYLLPKCIEIQRYIYLSHWSTKASMMSRFLEAFEAGFSNTPFFGFEMPLSPPCFAASKLASQDCASPFWGGRFKIPSLHVRGRCAWFALRGHSAQSLLPTCSLKGNNAPSNGHLLLTMATPPAPWSYHGRSPSSSSSSSSSSSTTSSTTSQVAWPWAPLHHHHNPFGPPQYHQQHHHYSVCITGFLFALVWNTCRCRHVLILSTVEFQDPSPPKKKTEVRLPPSNHKSLCISPSRNLCDWSLGTLTLVSSGTFGSAKVVTGCR